MNEYNPEKYIDPKHLMVDLLPSWRSIGNHKPDDCIGYQIESIFREFVHFDDDDYYQLLTAYSMLSQKWSKVLPVVFCYGLPGSGKSRVSLLTAYLHNQEYTFSPADTFPSIRNTLDAMRWLDDNKEYERDGAILCWDNLGGKDLERDPRLYQLLLYGYNRNTDKIMIANTDGTNKVFHVFCPKIISSIEPLHLDPDFTELQRRFMVIHHKKSDAELPAPEDYDFTGFPELFFNFWHNKDNCMKYAAYRNSASKRKWTISPSQKTISIDLCAIHALIYDYPDVTKSIELIQRFWANDGKQEQTSVVEEFLADWLLKRFTDLEVMHIKYLSLPECEQYLDTLEKGKLITSQERKLSHKVIAKLGYKRTTQGWCKI